MKATSFDIVQLLNLSLITLDNLTTGINLFYSRMPSTPQDCVTVYDNSGPSPMLQYVKSRSNYFYENISIRARDTNYSLAMVQMQTLLTYLHGRSQDVINGTYYALIKAINTPHLLHHDENDRPVLIMNFEVQRRPN